MRRFVLLCFLFTITHALVFAQSPPWNSTTNRPPAQWYPYPLSTTLWKQPIPETCIGNATPASYCNINPTTYGLTPSATTMVSYALTAGGQQTLTDPGTSDVPPMADF